MNYKDKLERALRPISEDLSGIATPTGVQPAELKSRFGQALRVLGQQLSIGSIAEQLKKRGIKAYESEDGQTITFKVQNAATGAEMPIAQINTAVLDNPKEFERNLLAVLDLSKGEAPGTEQQLQARIKNTEKSVRNIAKAVITPQQQQAQNGLQLQPVATVATPGTGQLPQA